MRRFSLRILLVRISICGPFPVILMKGEYMFSSTERRRKKRITRLITLFTVFLLIFGMLGGCGSLSQYIPESSGFAGTGETAAAAGTLAEAGSSGRQAAETAAEDISGAQAAGRDSIQNTEAAPGDMTGLQASEEAAEDSAGFRAMAAEDIPGLPAEDAAWPGTADGDGQTAEMEQDAAELSAASIARTLTAGSFASAENPGFPEYLISEKKTEEAGRIVNFLDSDRRLLEERYQAADGSYKVCEEGYAIVRYDYDEKGNKARVSYYDLPDRPVYVQGSGCAAIG